MQNWIRTIFIVVMIAGVLFAYELSRKGEIKTVGNGLNYIAISAEEAKQIMDKNNSEDIVILDVRTKEEYDEGHIKNAVVIPLDVIEAQAESKLKDKEKTILVYCRSGRRSKAASEILIKLGYQKVYDFGGINNWSYETVK